MFTTVSDTQEKHFTTDEAASILGTDKQTAVQEMEKAGVSPVRITTLPVFEWLLGK